MERRRPARRKTKRPSRVKTKTVTPVASTPWPALEAFFESGEGSIGLGRIDYTQALRHTAVISDDNNMLVALVRRRGETLHQLLDRLNEALGPAIDDGALIDEINK